MLVPIGVFWVWVFFSQLGTFWFFSFSVHVQNPSCIKPLFRKNVKSAFHKTHIYVFEGCLFFFQKHKKNRVTNCKLECHQKLQACKQLVTIFEQESGFGKMPDFVPVCLVSLIGQDWCTLLFHKSKRTKKTSLWNHYFFQESGFWGKLQEPIIASGWWKQRR